ncbi:hypothetical protein M413DRAFT_32554 [Hebeloma cylindrosporum]|uniref:Uncharacterized protein n=1 Tax=Hebeloma cylindrosporum TaxID=76867 RepID=A0A0C3BVE8_HEBCY|nr:hypothetical protein M413DRAFT_32554 [Hebeloma cylindrosporum h7]
MLELPSAPTHLDCIGLRLPQTLEPPDQKLKTLLIEVAQTMSVFSLRHHLGILLLQVLLGATFFYCSLKPFAAHAMFVSKSAKSLIARVTGRRARWISNSLRDNAMRLTNLSSVAAGISSSQLYWNFFAM